MAPKICPIDSWSNAGTGRLIEEVARAGFQVDGIDRSRSMLAVVNCRISQPPSETQALIRLHRLDMGDFCFNQGFGRVIVAANSFRELKTHSEQNSCLRCVHKHVHSDGMYLITERRFHPERFAPRDHVSWSRPITHPVTNDVVQRKSLVGLSEAVSGSRGIHGVQNSARWPLGNTG